LIGDDGHHEQKVEAEGPEDEEFGAFEVAAGDGMFLGAGELIMFEGVQDPRLIERGGRCR
jgi:hypothetical protein